MEEIEWLRWIGSYDDMKYVRTWFMRPRIGDQGFVEHSIDDGENRLRLTRGFTKPSFPTVIDVI